MAASQMANAHSIPSVAPESWLRWTRRTKGGRAITYDLSVIQQPERARACGSGPKSSADRRPVDPPPIVKLQVYEGESVEEGKEITMDYNSDFFLFVSLENARPMAHGRVQTPAATTPPVLTGVPVSACCYLDRPVPAGYFLFPDLSVRHEGRYKLIFRLYERNKDPEDANMPTEPVDHADMMEDEDLFFTFLNEVRSVAFTVYSAKKFPGLTESTALSRAVAEQGCRVRIRRDVRMRRRDTKASGQGDYEPREEEYPREPRTQSPADAYRHRSSSNSSLDRRPSGYDHPTLAPSQRILNFAPPGYSKPYQPPAPPSEPVSPATRGPNYRHPSFTGAPAYPSTPTYPTAYGDRPPPSVHEDRRPSVAYPSPVSSYGSSIQSRIVPAPPPVDTSGRSSNATLPSFASIKSELMSPIVPDTPNSLAAAPASYPPNAMKRQRLADTSDGHKVLAYKRSSGNVIAKHPAPYMEDLAAAAAIDPRLRAEDEHTKEENTRKRPFRSH
ncbi:velvet factor-domain-containing protein [Xylariales sp. PMI_506]|nr:velvet factor-domain-containing protein [Xylariales sp. PMI_506]